MFIRTSTIARGMCCSLIYSFLYLFVVRIGSRGHLRGAGNDLQQIVNIDSWRIEPRSCQPCSKICYIRDRCYCFEYFVELFVDSCVLLLLLVYKISERLSGIFHRFLYIHRFGRSRWRRGVLLQRLSFFMFGNV